MLIFQLYEAFLRPVLRMTASWNLYRSSEETVSIESWPVIRSSLLMSWWNKLGQPSLTGTLTTDRDPELFRDIGYT